MKISLRFRIEKVLTNYNIRLWNPGISESPNGSLSGSYFTDPRIIRALIQAFRNEENKDE